jgi:hypothetical protein
MVQTVQAVLEKTIGDEEKLPTLQESDIKPPLSQKLPAAQRTTKGQEVGSA